MSWPVKGQCPSRKASKLAKTFTRRSCWLTKCTLFSNKEPNPNCLWILGFVSLLKNTIMFTDRKLHKDKLTFFLIFWPVRKETWPSKNFFGWSSCLATVWKLFWALLLPSHYCETNKKFYEHQKYLWNAEKEKVNTVDKFVVLWHAQLS